jgi:hypothetical protein
MGKGKEGIAASTGRGSENDGPGSCEAHDVRGRPQEDRGVPEGTLGEVEGGAEEGSLEAGSLRRTTRSENEIAQQVGHGWHRGFSISEHPVRR